MTYLTNKNMRAARAIITGVLFSLTFGALAGDGNQALGLGLAAFSFIGGLVVSLGYTASERRGYAFSACGAITAGIEIECNDPLVAGVDATFYIANKDEIASITFDPTNPMLATDITMVATKTFYAVEGQLQSNEPSFAMVKGKYVNQCEHTVGFLVFKIDPATKAQILQMKDGNFVCIVKNNYTGATGNSKYEIYGAQAGLKADVMERNPNDTENLGAYKITLKTQEYARESKPPVSLFDTDLATTEALVAGLL